MWTMIIYAALLRGIMPMNPNMKGEKLKETFESLGFKNVSTVIASGNVVFTSASKDTKKMEAEIEKAFIKKLGFASTTIIRSFDELKEFVGRSPFKGIKDEKPNYLIVTFFKNRQKEIAQVLNLDDTKTANFMSSIEKTHGKEITTRTWKTVHRILKRMESIG
ncbi:MAG: hypothetical protein JWL80_350 [Parcubacteria group bacterium]|nr:hypothetical protein [Parcubacteria group bacterium]